jgi:hypothetical protein
MSLLRLFARYAYVPFMLIGINGCAVMWAAQGVRLWKGRCCWYSRSQPRY